MKNLPFQGTETDRKRIGKGCQKNDSSNSPFAILMSTFCHPFAIILRSVFLLFLGFRLHYMRDDKLVFFLIHKTALTYYFWCLSVSMFVCLFVLERHQSLLSL